MTEEDLGMQLQEAYENRLYGKVVDALLEESSA